LAIVPEFLAGLKASDVRHGKLLAAIAAALEDSADQIFMFPGKAAEQNGYLAELLSGERSFHRSVEVGFLIEPGNFPQAGALCLQSLFVLRVVFNLDEIRSHDVLRPYAEFWRWVFG
jgi:hypothetical protein